MNWGWEMTSNVSKRSDRSSFYVNVCVAYLSAFKTFCILKWKKSIRFTCKNYLRNASFSTMLLCSAKDNWEFRMFSRGLKKILWTMCKFELKFPPFLHVVYRALISFKSYVLFFSLALHQQHKQFWIYFDISFHFFFWN